MKEQEEDNMRDCSEAFVDQSILFLMQHLSSARFRHRVIKMLLALFQKIFMDKILLKICNNQSKICLSIIL